MKATDLISTLEQLVEQHGDLDVRAPADDGGYEKVNSVCHQSWAGGEGWFRIDANED